VLLASVSLIVAMSGMDKTWRLARTRRLSSSDAPRQRLGVGGVVVLRSGNGGKGVW